MKRIYKFLLFTIISASLYSCKNKDTNLKKMINSEIEETQTLLKKKNYEKEIFPYLLQENLENLYCYNIDENKYLINYNNSIFIYENSTLKKDNISNYIFVDNIEEAFNYEIGTKIFTKGYNNLTDGGNCFCTIVNPNEDNQSLILNSKLNKALKYNSFDSTISINQLGYFTNNALDIPINEFTNNINLNHLYIPSGTYFIENCFDINTSNKYYSTYNSLIDIPSTYSPSGNNKGCLFYVYNDISNIKINGFSAKVNVNEKMNNPMLGILSARDVDNLSLLNCSFYIPKEASIYSSSGLIDLFTGWSNVIIKNNHLENHSSTVVGGGIGLRDIYKKGCYNALIEDNYIYSNCKDEVIAIFSGADTSLYPSDQGGGSIENVIFKNNIIVGGKPNKDLPPRVVGITIGYQISPVSNIQFISNQIEMYSANYLLLYGKANNVTFKNNDIKIDASYSENLYIMFSHNSYADKANDIIIDGNSFETINDSSLYTISSSNEEFNFINNKINANKITRVFDSKSTYENNIINVNSVTKCVYHNVKETKNNILNADYVNVVYEFYNLNISDDIIIEDKINCNSIGANFMMFNGNSITFNNHLITFKNFIFNCTQSNSKYYFLAYDTSIISDKCIIKFISSSLSIYDDENHNYIAKDPDNKVTLIWE